MTDKYYRINTIIEGIEHTVAVATTSTLPYIDVLRRAREEYFEELTVVPITPETWRELADEGHMTHDWS